MRWGRQFPLGALIESSFSECSRVGTLTVEAITTHCPNLLSLDLSHTSVTPVSLAGVLQNCGRLETLKVAAIKNWVWVLRILEWLTLIDLPCRPMRPSKNSPRPSLGLLYLTFGSSNSANSSSPTHPSLRFSISVVV